MTTETGLPELPEGHFWRVRYHHRYSSYGIDYVDRTRLQVQLIETRTTTWIATQRKWFRNKEISYTDVDKNALFTEDCQGTNPIAVRNAANRIMKLWEKAKVRDALVGDYPPKTLEVP